MLGRSGSPVLYLTCVHVLPVLEWRSTPAAPSKPVQCQSSSGYKKRAATRAALAKILSASGKVGPTALTNALTAVEFQCENRLEPALPCDF